MQCLPKRINSDFGKQIRNLYKTIQPFDNVEETISDFGNSIRNSSNLHMR